MNTLQIEPTKHRVKTNPVRSIECERDGYKTKIVVYRNAFHIREYGDVTELSYGRLADFANRIIAGRISGYTFELGTPGDDSYIWSIERKRQ